MDDTINVPDLGTTDPSAIGMESPPMAVAVATAIPVATASTEGQPAAPTTYAISDAQREGAKVLRCNAILLIIFSLLSIITPCIVFAPPVDLIMCLVTSSLALHWTHPSRIEEISKHTDQTCCGFRAVYGLAITSSVFCAIFGVTRFSLLLFGGFFGTFKGMALMIFFGIVPFISAILSTTFAAFISSHSAPYPEMAPFTEATVVLGEAESPVIVIGCSPKKSRCICWIFVSIILIVVIICCTTLQNEICASSCSPYSRIVCYKNKNWNKCELLCEYGEDVLDSVSYGDCRWRGYEYSHWGNDSVGWVDGRPFMIQTDSGELSLSSPLVKVDTGNAFIENDVSSWCSDPSISGDVNISELNPITRLKVAKKWTEAGLAEHASVASFARFSLQLMASGAPPSLLKEAHEAAAQEVTHAIISFDLAKFYDPDGTHVAPGEFPLSSSLQDASWSLEELAKSTAKEGCIEETLAAIGAAIRLGSVHSTNSRVRDALTTIATDEADHAALAWKTVAWALRKSKSNSIRSEISDIFSFYLPSSVNQDVSLNLPTHGWWPNTRISALRATVFKGVIHPWADALLADETPRKPNFEEQPALNDIMNVIYQNAFIFEEM